MKFTKTKRLISIPVYLSPLILFGVLFQTQLKGAYPSNADSASIPMMFYFIFVFPIACWIVGKIPFGELTKLKLYLWDSKRPWFSGLSLILTIYPVGAFWISFVFVSFSSGSYASGVLCVWVFCAMILSRTYAIQPIPETSEIN